MYIQKGILLVALATVLVHARPQWVTVWRDEFNGPKDAPPDASRWGYDLGAGGWGNHELETYTKRIENVSQDGQGHLVIRAIKLPSGSYTSGRIKMLGKFGFQYGRVEARIKMPSGQGLWPAFWMLGNDLQTVGWPNCGEIDIMENIGKEPGIIHSTVHGPGYSGSHGISAKYTLPLGQFASDFHVFLVEWEPNIIRFYVDQRKYSEITPASLPARAKWVFNHPFRIVLDLAVGGDWPGVPDNTTIFPQTMLVDWVRIWRASTPKGQ